MERRLYVNTCLLLLQSETAVTYTPTHIEWTFVFLSVFVFHEPNWVSSCGVCGVLDISACATACKGRPISLLWWQFICYRHRMVTYILTLLMLKWHKRLLGKKESGARKKFDPHGKWDSMITYFFRLPSEQPSYSSCHFCLCENK